MFCDEAARTWLASLLPANSNKGTLFSTSRQKIWHLFSGRHLLGLEKLLLGTAEVATVTQGSSELHKAKGRGHRHDRGSRNHCLLVLSQCK